VDIEILLEAAEKIEYKDEDLLTEFYESNVLKLEKNPVYASVINKRILSNEIKTFIKKYFNQTNIQTNYLQYLKGFLEPDKSLPIFSTNYDICIEQFCKKNGIQFVDTFDPKIKIKNGYNKQNAEIVLCKLHGSITWYRTEQGDYILGEMMPIPEKVQNAAGQDTIPLILYPGRKFEFFGPLFDNLAHLSMALKAVKYAIVVGYSFKDRHIAKIFDLAARENKDLILFLVSPSACKIYEHKLEVIEDPEFIHGFTYRGFDDKCFDTEIPSNLEGRVISLPYRFAKIFPLLKLYREKLEVARQKDKEVAAARQETQSKIQEWRDCLKLYVECEYMARASKIVRELSLEVLISDDWASIFETMFRGFLNALSCNDPLMIVEWKQNLSKVSELFATDKFSFDPMIENNIRLDTISNIATRNFANSLHNAVLITEDKLSIVNAKPIEQK